MCLSTEPFLGKDFIPFSRGIRHCDIHQCVTIARALVECAALNLSNTSSFASDLCRVDIFRECLIHVFQIAKIQLSCSLASTFAKEGWLRRGRFENCHFSLLDHTLDAYLPYASYA